MEELKVTFTDKVSIVTKPVPLINKVTDADMNELKNKHNDTVDVLTTVDGRLTTAEGDITAVDGRLTTAEGDITAVDGRLTTAEGDITTLGTSKQNNLGITDETTHLLTPKEIREGVAVETKLITSQEADTKIATEVPTISPQFTIVGGQAFFATEFQKSNSSNIAFVTPSVRANQFEVVSDEVTDNPIIPLYYFLSIDRNNPQNKHRNKSIAYHSSILLPDIFTPNKPEVSRVSRYVSQAAMLADQANQTTGRRYYHWASASSFEKTSASTANIADYTEVTNQINSSGTYQSESAMLNDQLNQVTDNHYEYTGSTSVWRKTSASTGVIGDYEEVVAISGWQEWGTKPDWLIVSGDAYQVGVDNMNELNFQFHRFFNGQPNIVTCEIVNLTGLNSDPNRLSSAMAFDIDFNSNQNLSLDNDLPNNAPYLGSLFLPEVLRPADAVWVDLTGGRYALRMGVAANNLLQSYIKFLMSGGLKFYSLNRFTFIVKMRSPSGTANVGYNILQNHNTVDTNGFSCFITTGNQIRLRMAGSNSSNNTLSPAFMQQGNFQTFCYNFNGTNITITAKSAELSKAYTIEVNNASFSQVFQNLKELVIGNNALENTANRGVEYKHARLFWTSLTAAQAESQVNEIDAL
jgi:hypothetical protein